MKKGPAVWQEAPAMIANFLFAVKILQAGGELSWRNPFPVAVSAEELGKSALNAINAFRCFAHFGAARSR